MYHGDASPLLLWWWNQICLNQELLLYHLCFLQQPHHLYTFKPNAKRCTKVKITKKMGERERERMGGKGERETSNARENLEIIRTEESWIYSTSFGVLNIHVFGACVISHCFVWNIQRIQRRGEWDIVEGQREWVYREGKTKRLVVKVFNQRRVSRAVICDVRVPAHENSPCW